MKTIVLASNNQNKIKEISKLLEEFNIEVKSLKELGLGDPIEDGQTFEENAIIKAKYAFDKTGLPSLADDSGFCVESMNGFPGLCSARFADAAGGHEKAMEMISKCINPNNKKSNFITAMAFVYNKDGNETVETFEGKLDGDFVYPPRGNNGFGYCPCFLPNGYSETFGEMANEVRTKMNHRAIALNKFIEFLKDGNNINFI